MDFFKNYLENVRLLMQASPFEDMNIALIKKDPNLIYTGLMCIPRTLLELFIETYIPTVFIETGICIEHCLHDFINAYINEKYSVTYQITLNGKVLDLKEKIKYINRINRIEKLNLIRFVPGTQKEEST